jgi:peroxiredoxin
MAEFEKRNTTLLAVSVDSLADAQEMIDMLNLTFPVGYGLDPIAFAEKTGAFYETERNHIQATDFILKPDGAIVNSVYASGPIGRLWPEDCIRVIDFYNQQKG